ncbi:MAG: BrnA antitoxin family protein [Rhodoferax sp.]|nr:BrnA antitoxin family protein [Rhodoferax sp.]
MTDEQQRRLEAIADMPDASIDYSDIPRQTAPVQWIRPGKMLPVENKRQITLRVDADVLSFFKGTGKRYQSRINAALREYVNAHQTDPNLSKQ